MSAPILAKATPCPYGDLDWRPEKVADTLQRVFDYVTKETAIIKQWYERARAWRRLCVIVSRSGAIIAASAAGIIPILAQVLTRNGNPVIPPAWASIALVVAAMLLLLDRQFGFTASCIRYTEAILRLNILLQDFRTVWEAERVGWEGRDPTSERVVEMLHKARATLLEVYRAVGEEAANWIEEQKKKLDEMQEALTSRP